MASISLHTASAAAAKHYSRKSKELTFYTQKKQSLNMNTSHYHERMSIKVGVVDELCRKVLGLDFLVDREISLGRGKIFKVRLRR